MGWVDACSKRSSADTWLDSAQLDAWYKARGAQSPLREIEPVCREIIVGRSAERALFCERIQHETRAKPGSLLHTYRVLTLLSLRTVRGKQVVTLLEVPLQVDLLDKEELDDGPLFALDLDTRKLPDELALLEPELGACAKAEQALKRHRDQARASNDHVQVAWARLDEELRARLCRSVGEYRWQKARFARSGVRALAPVGASTGP